ncbi:ABC transporter ATP-binding protein [Anabaena sp. FACHB-709]|uniref:ABC transporter, nitrate transport ATP-binding protein NrtC n=2 Tax=Nostocaceae TaxID=1162 RepID=A0A1Z4KJA7_ANAVA|nr:MULTISPECIES: ABC transporter ATP-binding protein [Nostocaceae]BAY68963.1 ABC transporter, nitrate transport ATP-binding protein NrtC [Trichormus variabilis NIES-23]HBW33468.1 ABC transporter ATP-binding protein [Nostoc sp. UBA8866]MBD2170535.1 ABC transporter ATP-binding protein [Anabaena cylindrica FACHB-318]MBD2261989.1 ABC transporter ATP-binding protein [Anabaena sp. FACHB-709]MBD2271868.1 ABC transporter ATP-binding protein [Nostoc sp. PCC 7120 = FACHB-418]
MPSFVEIRDIKKEFVQDGSNNIVLKDINLEIQQGNFVSLIGHSGCGKSTLLNIVAGLEKPTQGQVQVDGQIVKRPFRDRMVVFQNYSLLPWLTAWENVALFVDKAMPRKSKNERREIIASHLEMVGLKDAAQKKPAQLSGGMKQRVALARALAVQPKLLLLDEPFGALDALTRGSLQVELMRICNIYHITTIMVTHDVDEALLLSDQVVMLKNGPAATIGQILDIPFEHPRSLEIRDSPQYHHLRQQLMQFLQGQEQAKRLHV